MSTLPTKEAAKVLLEEHVQNQYQRYHALMVGTAMEGYAGLYEEDPLLWFLTGYLHDLDYEKFPEKHPGPSLNWFKEWGYPDELIHAVEAHAYGYNGFDTLPEGKLACALMACDEISGIFYAYRKLNPIPYGEMKVKSIRKRLKEKAFAAKIERETIYMGCERLGVALPDHITNLVQFYGRLT
ncbi:MAG: HD domain-containing protein [Bacteroidota bacterium]